MKEKCDVLKNNAEARRGITAIIQKCYHTMPLYGKNETDFLLIVATFMEYLADYEVENVLDAFRRYIRERREFPTVSDIIGLLENRIKPDKAVYYHLKKKQRDAYLSQREEDYIAAYQRQVLSDWS